MGWAVGYDTRWSRDIGYGVPAICDAPECGERIDRGLSQVCGGRPYGGEEGCGLFFCDSDLYLTPGKPQRCGRCCDGEPPCEPTPDLQEWTDWKMTDESWAAWRAENGIPEPARSPA